MSRTVPQLVLILNDQDQITAEFWDNGQRTVERVMSFHQITAILQDQKARIKSQAQEAAEKQRAADVARHNRVYAGVAVKHGILMAKRTVGEPIKPGRPRDPNAPPPAPAKVAADAADFDL